MRVRAHHIALAAATFSVTAYAGFWLSRSPTPRVALATPPPAPVESTRVRTPLPVVEPPPAPKARGDEPRSISELRTLRLTDPEAARRLAERYNAEAPDSADAPERAWIIVRTLDDQRRFHEAREAARAMVERYPGTSWTNDVERHTLVYPLDQPSREEQQARLPTPEIGAQ